MAYFHCLIGGGSSGGGYELTVTCDADFAGITITCTDGVTTLTQTCPSASPYDVVFAIPNGGEWTISGIISGQTYSASIDIPDSLELHSIPEGSTVLPTDDIQIWLKCAGITDKAYTTLNEVLADSTTLLALISNNNASDYLVRSTTWASGLTADSTAMTDIGANNYCANTLLADSTWATAICNSTYFESVLNVKVPTMTSNTTPSGECIASSYDSNQTLPYKAFDNNSETSNWPALNQTSSGYYLGYTFPNASKIKKATLTADDFNASYYYDLAVYGGNNLSSLTKISNTVRVQSASKVDLNFNISNNDEYSIYVIKCEATNAASMYVTAVAILRVWKLQFYGREDV